MTLVKFKPARTTSANHFGHFSPFSPLWDNLFAGLNHDTRGTEFSGLVPAVNITEQADAYHVFVAAPGLSKENFQLSLANNLLTIKGSNTSAEKDSTTEESAETKAKFLRREFAYGQFERSFSLPNTINAEGISASYDQGILTVTLPKRDEAKVKEPRTIEIA